MKVIVLLIVAAAGVAVLTWVMVYGSTRRRRMAQFVRKVQGTWSLYDDFDLQNDVDELFGRGEWWVGGSGRIGETESTGGQSSLYLLDLHADPEGPAQRTAVLVKASRHESATPLVLRETMETAPSPEGPDTDRFDVSEGDLPDVLRARLDNLPDDRDWLVELRRSGALIAVSSRDRPLSNPGEWQQLLDATEVLTRE